MRLILTLVIAIAVLLAAAVFGSFNDQPVVVNTVLATHELRLAYALLIAFALGIVVGLCFAGATLWRARVELKRARGDVALKDKELNELRTLPVRDSR